MAWGRVRSVGGLVLAAACLWAPSSAFAFVYWTNNLSSSVSRASLDATNPNRSFVPANGATGGVAVDGQHVYWANDAAGTIGRANLDGSGVDQSFITGATQPSGVAVNAGHVYWTNEGANSIGEAFIDGSSVNQDLVTTGASPDGVAVSAARIYWANSANSTIGSAQLNSDGSISGGITNTLITSPSVVSDPTGIATDGTSIYWANSGDGSIGRATATGTDATEVITGLDLPTSVASDAGHLYWTSYTDNEIGRSGLDGSGETNAFITGLYGPTGLAVDAGALPPGTSIALSPAAPTGNGGWYRSGVGVTVSGTQDFYPVSETRCGVDLTPTPAAFPALPAPCGLLGAGTSIATAGPHTVYAASQDTHGDAGVIATASFKIDTTSPMLACRAAPTFSLGRAGATVGATVSDPGGSGPVATSVTSVVDTSASGSRTVTLTGSDLAGNSSSIVCPYTVEPTIVEPRFQTLNPRPVFHWRARTRRGATAFVAMTVARLPAGAGAKLACSGRGCPFRTRSVRVPRSRNPTKPSGTVDLLPLLRGHTFHAGAKLTLLVTRRETIGRAWVLTMQKRSARPKQLVDCQLPGSSKLQSKCM